MRDTVRPGRVVTMKRGLGGKMAGGNPDPARGRAMHDFYATPELVTQALYTRYADRLRGAVVWEPCAGDGSMAIVLERLGCHNVACSDYAPTVESLPDGRPIAVHNVLDTKAVPPVSAIITNPPYNIAPPIIQTLCGLIGTKDVFLALLLKSTFWHAATRHHLFLAHPPTAVHPLLWRPDFKQLGAPTMDCSWFVWNPEDRGFQTSYEPLTRPTTHER